MFRCAEAAVNFVIIFVVKMHESADYGVPNKKTGRRKWIARSLIQTTLRSSCGQHCHFRWPSM